MVHIDGSGGERVFYVGISQTRSHTAAEVCCTKSFKSLMSEFVCKLKLKER